MINRVLRTRRDLANNRRGIARLRRVIKRFFENFKMPIVKIHTAAIRRLAWADVNKDKVARERDNRRFKDLQSSLFIGIQVLPAFTFCLGIEIGHVLEETSRIEGRHRQSGKIGRPAIL
jgi:hypothetical protein